MTNVVQMQLSQPYFNMVVSGKKTYELRLADAKRSCISVGDLIVFKAREDEMQKVSVKVDTIQKFATFRDALIAVGLHNSLPGAISIDEGEKAYMGFPEYKEKEVKLGVLAIGLQLVSPTLLNQPLGNPTTINTAFYNTAESGPG